MGYPPPVATGTAKYPDATDTEEKTFIDFTITPYPITPFPTLTLRPGPSPTFLPLLEPAKDSSGSIYFMAQGNKEEAFKPYSVTVNSFGQKTSEAFRVSSDDIPSGTIIFPSPDGSRLAILGPWGEFSIFNTVLADYEPNVNPLGYGTNFYNWFADSTRILSGSGSLFLSDPSTEEIIRLVVSGYGSVISAAASPDGQYVVYSYSTHVLYPYGTYIINTNGQNQHLLTDKLESPYFAWSPDGKLIVSYDLQVINADGSNLRKLAPGISIPHCYPSRPIWSPDSSTIAIVTALSDCGEFSWEWSTKLFEKTYIVLIDVETGKARPLLPDGSTGNIDPAWSPDGSQLAFVSIRSGTPEVWVINADGSGLRQMTEGHQMVRFPVWRKRN